MAELNDTTDTAAVELSADAAFSWSMLPDCRFVSESLSLPEKLPTIDGEDKRLLESIFEYSAVDFVSSEYRDPKIRSFGAMQRYQGVLELHEKYPQNICFLLLLGECHFLLQDRHGSLELIRRSRDLLLQEGHEDATLDAALTHIGALAAVDALDGGDDGDDGNQGIEICRYARPPRWQPSSEPSNLASLVARWGELQGKSDGSRQFARLACVATNELEGVFALEGDSSKRLARCGFFANSIEGISRFSRHAGHPGKIISILKNTQGCYAKLVRDVADGNVDFTHQFLITTHRKLLNGDNVNFDCDQRSRTTCISLVPMGVYRHTNCFASHQTRGYETRFCPPQFIEQEMNFYLEQVSTILETNDEIDPYRAAAYIQHVFLRIHPFADGNGRVSRLISSIPLLKVGLPPVIVAVKSKKQYFKHLKKADDKGDVDGLARFLQEESFRAIGELLEYNPDDSPSRVVYRSPHYNSRRVLEQRYRAAFGKSPSAN